MNLVNLTHDPVTPNNEEVYNTKCIQAESKKGESEQGSHFMINKRITFQ